MSPDPSPPPDPAAAVERIREILVGRELAALEQRVSTLETQPHALPPLPTATATSADDFRKEIRRLAQQIQQVAAAKSTEEPPATRRLERKLGNWLHEWQSSIHVHLRDRDRRLIEQLRSEVASLWETTESQLTRLESRIGDQQFIEERLAKVAAAARALAESATPPLGPTAH